MGINDWLDQYDDILAAMQDAMGESGGKKKPADDGSQPSTPPKKKPAPVYTEDTSSADNDEVLQENAKTPAELAAYITRLRRVICANVLGQDSAVDNFLSGYFRGMLPKVSGTEEKSDRKRPMTFLFAGPPGTGKTMLAEEVAKRIGRKYKRFDMSEYGQRDEMLIAMIGSAAVYKDSEAGGLTSFVKENPNAIILFDEIEKLPDGGINMFLQLLDSGRLTDKNTKETIDFSNTIIIMTTNAGRQLYEEGRGDFSTLPKKIIIEALKTDTNADGIPFFPPAICSRFAHGNVSMFNRIRPNVLRRILKKQIGKKIEAFGKNGNLQVEVDEDVYTAILFAQGGEADARTITGRGEAFFAEEFYELLRLTPNGDKIKKVKISVDFSDCEPEVCEKFEFSEFKPRGIVIADPATAELCVSKFSPFMDIKIEPSVESAIKTIKRGKTEFVLLDFDGERSKNELNIEDVMSPAREVLTYISENDEEGLYVYGLDNGAKFTDEERASLLTKGVYSFVDLSSPDIDNQIQGITIASHQNKAMADLARHNKIIAYSTRQSITENGTCGEICLFDFRSVVAATSEESKELLDIGSVPDVSFGDITGAEDAKEELREFIGYLKDPRKYADTGLNPPRGILFYGPPGTGKTMLAKAVAAEAGVTFIATEGNRFIKSYYGQGKDEVHRIFRIAKKYSPTVLFIDEIDAIGAARNGSEHSEALKDVLTALLTNMDGFNKDNKRPVLVIAATNYGIEKGSTMSLDEALVRRFDRNIYVDLPTKEERKEYLNKIKGKNPALAEITDAAIENLADRSVGMSLAKLSQVIDMSLRFTMRRGLIKVTDEILDEAFETFTYGEARDRTPEEILRTARHEAGHALVCHVCCETPSYLTIISRGDHGGYMQHADSEKGGYTKAELLGRIRTSLAGRAAEIFYYGSQDGISTGASGDLNSATRIAQNMICTYGMDDEFGIAVTDKTDRRAIARVNAILTEQMEETIAIIRENKDKLDALVSELIAKNSLNGKAIGDILK